MTDLTFAMLDGRRSQMLLQSNILCSTWTPWFGTEMSNIMKENDESYLSLTCWTSLEATLSVCFADFFNLLGTTSSSSVENASKYNSSAKIFKFYLRQSGLMVSVLNPEWSRWLCFLFYYHVTVLQAHLTLNIFPIQSSHSINNESHLNPFVELSCIKIQGLYMYHDIQNCSMFTWNSRWSHFEYK